MTYNLSCANFKIVYDDMYLKLLNPPTYDLNTYNCTDFAIESLNLIGLGVPDPVNWWWCSDGSHSNPGSLGEALRDLPILPGVTVDTQFPAVVCDFPSCP